MYTIIKKRKEKLVYCGESCEGIDLAEHLTYSVQYASRVHTFYVYCVTVVCVNYLWIIDAIAAGLRVRQFAEFAPGRDGA